MRRAPMPPKRPTVHPARAPRVRSIRSAERCVAGQIRRTERRGSLARTSPAATARPAARTPGAIATIRTALGSFASSAARALALSAYTSEVPFTATGGRFSLGLRRQCLHREPETSSLIAFEKLDLYAVSLLHDVFGFLRAAVLQLRDVHQTFGTGHDLDERAEGSRALHGSFVGIADYRLRGERLDHLTGPFHRLAANSRDRNQSRVVHGDLGARLFLDAADRLSLGADEVADLLGTDVHRHDAWSVRREIGTRLGQGLGHLSENVKSALARLRHGLLHDLQIESLDLDVHLDRGDSLLCSCDLEVHVAKMILGAEDVGEDRVLAAFLDEAHRHAGDGGAKRNAGIEESQRATTDRRHRRRSVRFKNVRHDTNRVRELLERRQHALQRALGQVSVADLATAGAAHRSHFASRERWEVV